jgi:hypothetical protein
LPISLYFSGNCTFAVKALNARDSGKFFVECFIFLASIPCFRRGSSGHRKQQ